MSNYLKQRFESLSSNKTNKYFTATTIATTSTKIDGKLKATTTNMEKAHSTVKEEKKYAKST